MTPRILVCDPIAEDGVETLRQFGAHVDVRTGLSPEELRTVVNGYQALIVRSETKITRDIINAAPSLQVIGRAGVGVDNIDIDAATEKGVVVVNAPTGNIISAAEHAIALMLALARRIPEADASLRSGKWERSRFIGLEVRGKTLGVIGLGQVGSEVARRAKGLEMRVIAFDPFVPEERARVLGVELVTKDRLLQEADFVTIHTILTEGTRKLLGEAELRAMKPTARVINTARGGIIDEVALEKALREGWIAGAALDVFEKEPITLHPLFQSNRVVVTPHLGASTAEAQERVAVDVAEQVIAILQGQPARYAVNAPLIPPETYSYLAPYLPVAFKVASLAVQLHEGQMGEIEINYWGEIAQHDLTPLKAAIIVRVKGLTSETRVSGNVAHDGPHVVSIDGYWVDIPPGEGYLLLCENRDRPGMVGAVGTLLGEFDVNISFMNVGRHEKRGMALMVLALDESLSPEQLERVRQIPDIFGVRLARL